ncbi:MAG: rhamnulokinase [Dehalococcoidia bacterium]|nr:rhamnulokinase [Dehalococcoidia bacterium]
MKKTVNSVAVDLGASGGKVMLGRFDGSRITLEEIYRFPNGPIQAEQHIYWDVRRLFEEVKKGLGTAGRTARLDSVGLDAWGNDFCLLDGSGALLENPHSYRDPRTDGMMKRAFEKMSREDIYNRTGVQFMQHNTLFQVYSMVLDRSPQLEAAATYLMIADLFNYWLCGEKRCEFTNATTTQFYDPNKREWCLPILLAFDIPHRIMPPIAQPATKLGMLQAGVCDQLGIPSLPVIAVGTHDTASAAVAVPYNRSAPSGAPTGISQGSAFLSSGTWSLLGAEVGEPLINAAGLKNNFTCYGGVGGAWLVWKNIQALWVLQECMRNWEEAGQGDTLDGLIKQAEQAQVLPAVIDVDNRLFLTPGDFPPRIAEYCRRTGQLPPGDKGAIVRCILESLALKYRYTYERLPEGLGRKLDCIHIIGGGSLNTLLNRFTADAVGVPVVAGPAEATALGNFLVQLMALGEIGSLSQAREIVARSFETVIYEPGNTSNFDDAYARFLKLV